MSSIFKTLDTNGMEEAKDMTGGGSFTVPSNIYLANIKTAYEGLSKNNAAFVRYVFEIDGKEYSQTLYVTNRNGDAFYMKDNKKMPLPGYSRANAIAVMVTGKELHEQEVDTKVVKVYDYDAGKEVNQEVPMHVDLIGGQVYLGMLEVVKDKYQGDGTVTINEVDAVFHKDSKQTLNEALGKRDASFYDKWLESNEGKQRDISGESSSKGSTQGSSDDSGSKRTKSLFG